MRKKLVELASKTEALDELDFATKDAYVVDAATTASTAPPAEAESKASHSFFSTRTLYELYKFPRA